MDIMSSMAYSSLNLMTKSTKSNTALKNGIRARYKVSLPLRMLFSLKLVIDARVDRQWVPDFELGSRLHRKFEDLFLELSLKLLKFLLVCPSSFCFI
jgi:hypothetical protein